MLTLPMVDEAHGRPEGTARRTFNKHRQRFVEGEDYFEVPYEECKEAFGSDNLSRPNGFERTQYVRSNASDPLKSAGSKGGYRGSMIFLSEDGYLLLVKPLDDDRAWQVQKELRRRYFAAPQRVVITTPEELVKLIDEDRQATLRAERQMLKDEFHVRGKGPKKVTHSEIWGWEAKLVRGDSLAAISRATTRSPSTIRKYTRGLREHLRRKKEEGEE